MEKEKEAAPFIKEPIVTHVSQSQPEVRKVSLQTAQATSNVSFAPELRKFSGPPTTGGGSGNPLQPSSPDISRKLPKQDRKWSTPGEMRKARSGIEPIVKDQVIKIGLVLIMLSEPLFSFHQTFEQWSDLLEDVHEQPTMENVKKIIPFYEQNIRSAGKGHYFLLIMPFRSTRPFLVNFL